MDARDCSGMRVATWPWPVLVVEIGRPIKRRGNKNLVTSRQRQRSIIQYGKVCSQHERQITLFLFVPPYCFLNDKLDKIKVQQRLTTLKLNLYRGRGRTKHEIEAFEGRFPRHIEFATIIVGTRHLAVWAGVLAAKRDNKYVQARKIGQGA